MEKYQLLDPTSCYPYHCKKGIPYRQTLRFNRICSDNGTFGRCCNGLKKWLMKRGYNKEMIRKQIFSPKLGKEKLYFARDPTTTKINIGNSEKVTKKFLRNIVTFSTGLMVTVKFMIGIVFD